MAPPGRSRDDETRDAVSKALALLHRHQMAADRRRGGAGLQIVRLVDVMGQALPKPALWPFLADDTPVLATIFVAAIEQLTGEDYSEAQQQAWAGVADDEEEFAKRLT